MSNIALPDVLSFDEVTELDILETKIKAGLKTFYEVGDALLQIRDGKLYREQFATFELYCQEKWQMTRQRAHQLINSAELMGDLSTRVDKIELPENEKQVRALKQFDAELQPVVLRLARGEAKATGKPLTAQMLTRVGEVLLEAENTGHVDTGSGEGTPISAAITVQEYETTQRQKQHQRDHYEGHDNQSKRKDVLSELNEKDQRLAQDAARDITSGHGGDVTLQKVALDIKRLSEQRDDWTDLSTEERRAVLYELFGKKQEASYKSSRPTPKPKYKNKAEFFETIARMRATDEDRAEFQELFGETL